MIIKCFIEAFSPPIKLYSAVPFCRASKGLSNRTEFKLNRCFPSEKEIRLGHRRSHIVQSLQNYKPPISYRKKIILHF